MFFHFSKRVLEIEIFCWGSCIYVVWDVLLGCYFSPFFKKSFGDRNILFVELFYVVWDLLLLVVLFLFF